MEKQHWLEDLKKELVCRKLPPLYVERTMAEFSDHFNDYLEDRMRTEAADRRSVEHELGVPSVIGAAAAAEFQRQRFSGRHPFFVFVVLPILSLPVLSIALTVGVLWALSATADALLPASFSLDEADVSWVVVALRLAMCAFIILPASGLAWLFCRSARKAALGWRWPAAACVLLALLGGCIFTNVQAKTPDKPGLLIVGVGVPFPTMGFQVVQLLAPLAIPACGFVRQRRRNLSVC